MSRFLPRAGWRAAICALGLMLWSASSSCGEGLDGSYPEMAWGPASNSLFKPSGGGGLILGDWFLCKDAACTAFEDTGMRFNADGTWTTLDAPGSSLEPGESYCEEQGEMWGGTYRVSGQTLTVSYRSSSKVAQLVFVLKSNDTATANFKHEGQDVVVLLRRVTPSRSSGPCQYDAVPQPVPQPMP